MAEKQVNTQRFTETWPAKEQKLAKGDEIKGRYQKTLEYDSKNGTVKCHVLDVDGVLTGVWGSAVIDRAMAENNVIGRTIRIVYQGKGTTQDGRALNLFDIFADDATDEE